MPHTDSTIDESVVGEDVHCQQKEQIIIKNVM